MLPQVPVVSWFDDVEDAELLHLLPVFEDLSQAEDVYTRLGELRAPWWRDPADEHFMTF